MSLNKDISCFEMTDLRLRTQILLHSMTRKVGQLGGDLWVSFFGWGTLLTRYKLIVQLQEKHQFQLIHQANNNQPSAK